MEGNEILWESSVEEVKNGYIQGEKEFSCVFCKATFEKGRIFKIEDNFYDAKKAVEIHIERGHNSSLGYLLSMNPNFLGISNVHMELLKLIARGFSDKEIGLKLSVAQSTIRNHRFKLRQKEKEAKMFLATMELLKSKATKGINVLENETIIDPHKMARAVDERYNITDKERQETIKIYIDENGGLKSYPAKEKKKIIVLSEIVKNFSADKIYNEKEVNRILERIFEDYATLRRGLVQYGFIDRSKDCREYKLKE